MNMPRAEPVVTEPPVPVMLSGLGLLPALLMNDKLAVVAALLRGTKVTVNEALEPGGIVAGKESPLREYSALLLLAEEMVMLAPAALKTPD